MSELLAVVGPHENYHLPPVVEFLTALYQIHPDTTIVSGGAKGIDSCAEQTWLKLGGKVISYRPKRISFDPEEWIIEVWELGIPKPRVYDHLGYPTAADFKSCAFLRNILIAETATRLTAFYTGRRSPGASFTEAWARSKGHPAFAFGLAA